MNKRKRAILFGFISALIALSMTTSFFFGYLLGNRGIGADFTVGSYVLNKNKGKPEAVDFSTFWDAWNLINKKFNGQIDTNKLLEGAIAGMAQSAGDPYTQYLSADELKLLDEELQGSFDGIGAEIGIRNEQAIIIAPLEDTPAKKADLRSGDIILQIDDKVIDKMSVEQVVSLIKGPKGTKVKLIIKRGEATLDKEITRETITVKSVSEEVVGNNIGYIKINTFGEETAGEVKQAINILESKRVKGYIIDLRSNPGGYLDSAVSIAGYFTDPGIVVWEKSKDNEDAIKTDQKRLVKNKPVKILINGGSASASEILAGALRDREGIKLIGEKSYGKGSVQVVDNLKQGALKITVAQWLTPKKELINNIGLSPDVEVKLTEDDYNKQLDPQIDKAIEEINK